jgi:hypothetical protein
MIEVLCHHYLLVRRRFGRTHQIYILVLTVWQVVVYYIGLL